MQPLRSFPLRPSTLSLLLAGSSALLAACDGGTSSSSGGGSGTTTETTTGGGGSGGSTAGGGAGGTTSNGGTTASGGTTTTSTTTTTSGSGGAVDPWAGPIEALADLDLGDVTFGAQKSFPIPDKTLGFTLQVEGETPSSVVGVYRLRPPVGGSVILNFAMVGHTNQTFGGQQFIGAADPQSDTADAFPVQSGSWKVTLGSDNMSGTGAKVHAWVRRTNDGLFHGGAIDVNLFVVPGAATQSYLNQVLDKFFPYVGLTKGTVTAYSLDNSYATIGSVDEYRQMLASSAAIPDAPAINLFVVEDFSDAAYGGAIGVAGGIPGSPMRHGTPQSGLAYQPTGDTNYDATILMHEIGHLGGLFHTTEFAITETDPLSDTPECPHDTIASKPDQCADKSNVMFPIAYGATSFTNAQLNVLHGSALYRGVLDEGGSPVAPFAVAPKGALPPAMTSDALPSGARSMPAAPDALERALGALWCGGGVDAAALRIARDPASYVARPGGDAASRLRAIALDTAAPVLLRKRALRLYFQVAKDSGKEAEALDTLLAIASEPIASVADRRVHAAALRLLRSARPLAPAASWKRIDAAIATAVASSDALVAAVASGR
ncbi:MAG: hypothetical protein U0441_30050 [Polyangiaceae bacterium]